MQRRIVTSHESPSRGGSPPRRREDSGRGPSPLSSSSTMNSSSSSSAEYQNSASRRRVLFILGPILAILLVIHLLSPARSDAGAGGLGGARNALLPGFGPRSGQSRRTDILNAAKRQRAKSAASGESANARARARGAHRPLELLYTMLLYLLSITLHPGRDYAKASSYLYRSSR